MFFMAVILLIIRAGAELALPNLMSDIVDYGIAQGGIESPVPGKMGSDTFRGLIHIFPEELQNELGLAYVSEPALIGQEAILHRAEAEISPELYYAITIALAQIHAGEDFNEDLAVTQAKAFIRAEYERLGTDMEAHQINYVLRVGLVMILVTLLSITVAIAQGFLSARIATGISRKVRLAIFDKVVGFTNTEYNNFSTASLITRSTNDVNQVQGLIAMGIRIVIYSPIMGVGGVLMVMGTDASMAWIVAVTIGAMMAVFALFIAITIPKFKIMQKLIDKVNLVTREGLTGMMVIRAFTTQKHEVARFDGANSNLKKVALFLARMGALQMPIIGIILNFSTILIVWMGASSIDAGNMAVGSMMAFIQYTMFVVWSFMMLAMIAVMLPRAQVSASRIMEILNTEQIVKDPENPVALNKARGDVEFCDVSFKYPGAEGYALQGVSFTAESGKMTAFVGSTGSGKTALINLIPRFYDATEGYVKVGGVDVKNATQKNLRGIIGYVPQKAVLFSGTIESNIKYAGEFVTDEEMHRASKIAQAEDFILEREHKYEDEIAQGGTNVSGGQRQRLSIARAIAKDPKIYIFDDSFSALDFKTDAKLRGAIAEEDLDATMLVVAQRIGTIKNADQIIVLDEGKIVGRGRHKELLKNCEVYRQIASSQLSEKELAVDLEDNGEVVL